MDSLLHYSSLNPLSSKSYLSVTLLAIIIEYFIYVGILVVPYQFQILNRFSLPNPLENATLLCSAFLFFSFSLDALEAFLCVCVCVWVCVSVCVCVCVCVCVSVLVLSCFRLESLYNKIRIKTLLKNKVTYEHFKFSYNICLVDRVISVPTTSHDIAGSIPGIYTIFYVD